MRAVVCRAFGPPEDLILEEREPARPGPGEVRVEVEAAGVNFPDTLIIEGKYQFRPDPPFVPGGEAAGRVVEVGAGVEGFAPGDPVVAWTGWGAFAEELVVKADRLMHRPETIEAAAAAGLGVAYGTAIHALKDRANLQPGETLLVTGAAGGTGLAAVEIGAAMGARVIAAASSPEKLALARAHGASDVIDYTETPLRDALKELTDGRGVDVVYDPVGGDLFETAARSLAWRGRILVVGFAAGAIPKLPTNLLLLKGSSAVGVFWGRFRDEEPEANEANFEQLFAWHAEGLIGPRDVHILPLEEAGKALRSILDRKATGKIVLVP